MRDKLNKIRKEYPSIFFKGLLMGFADIIPGVSGGTLALITGIYERLITGIKNIGLDIKKIDFDLFVPLGLGIIIAFLIGAEILPHLLEQYPAYVFAFFFGLIAASIKIVAKKIKRKTVVELLFGSAALFIAFEIVGLEYFQTEPTYWFIFIAGFIAICAMLLPGVSGSFMLLMMGQYKFMLEALRDLKWGYIFAFITGAVISLLSVSRVIAYCLKNYKSQTMAFLTGLMLGALRLPFREVVYIKDFHPELNFIWNSTAVLFVIGFLILGIALVFVIERLNNKK
jgi:putative membrane protein